MISLKTRKRNYKKLVRLKNKKGYLREYYSNIIYPEKFIFITKIYENLMKSIISFFASILIFAITPADKIKRNKVVHQVYRSYDSKEFNFIWLSTIFYILISFVPVIYIVSFLNITINDSIPKFTDYVMPYAKEKVPNISSNIFQTLFNTIIFDKFIPGGNLYFAAENKQPINSFFKIYALIPGSFIALPSLYISSGGYGKLISAYNYIFSHNKTGSYWGNKVKGLGIVITVSLLLWLFSTLNIFLQTSIWLKYKESVKWLSDLVYLLFVFMFIFVLFLVLFKITPSFKIKFKDSFRGSLISSIPTFILVVIYTYLYKLISYDKFGSAVGFFFSVGFFINWYIYFMFLGIIFNNAYYKNYVSSRTIPKKVYAWV
ncbi:YhjD/YihY/BrkB family envelope integrity protein [Mycoplasmopsis edwardii]|nr:YhjD/YihY/BrkB family envelope integrity protein [Mycoplasmopsis edwardii]